MTSQQIDTSSIDVEWYNPEIHSENIENSLLNHLQRLSLSKTMHYKKIDETDETLVQYRHWQTALWQDTPAVASVPAIFFGSAVSLGIPNGITWYQNHGLWEEHIAKKKHNELVKSYNTELKKLQSSENQIKEEKQRLMVEAEKIKRCNFQIERASNVPIKVIVCIGPTGYGKSVVCNRLIGNDKKIEELENSHNEPFDVAEYGDPESKTQYLDKKIIGITIKKEFADTSFILSVVDTPGAFDSNGNDDSAQNMMAEYLRASGGVNMFCLFFKFGSKIDANYQKLLDEYTKFWGQDFWKHCVIIITNCDDCKAKKLAKALPKTINRIKDFLKLDNDLPIYQFGDDNFELSRTAILAELTTRYEERYECDHIKSPFQKLKREIDSKYVEYTSMSSELYKLDSAIKETNYFN